MAYVSFKVTETYSHGLEGFTGGGNGQSLAVTQNSVSPPAAAEQHQV